MTAKILQMVNSSFFGLRRHVSSPSQAVSLLGLDIVKALVLSVHIFTQFDSQKPSCLSLERLWKHSFATGVFAKAIAKEEKQKRTLIDDSFMTGLLHDLGKLILSTNFPERYREVQVLAKERDIPPWKAESEVLGATHAQVGAYLIGLWGMEDPIVEGLAFHHCPSECQAQGFSPMLAVHVANSLEHQENGSDREEAVSEIDTDYLSELNMADQLTVWREICRQALQNGDMNE